MILPIAELRKSFHHGDTEESILRTASQQPVLVAVKSAIAYVRDPLVPSLRDSDLKHRYTQHSACGSVLG